MVKIPESLRWKCTGKTLGQGGQATVFVVTDKQNEFAGEYAFKAVLPGRPKKAYERFAKEIEATKSLDHPHIVRVYDHSAPDDTFQFYVMELIAGARPLKKLLNTPENPFAGNPLKSLKFFRQLASAIDACEQIGIVHRDLSPANVLILPSDDVKIIDFGCCLINESERVTLTDEGVGTPNYMAPECESGAEGEIRSTADLYSAGKLLWSAITNRIAFSREDAVYDSKSMTSLLPQQPMAWHLHHLYAATIRHKAKDRILKASAAIDLAERVESLITSGYPPLDLVLERCPLCGWGQLRNFECSHMVFGNPNPSGIRAVQCSHCGYCFAQSFDVVRKELNNRKLLR